MPDPDHHHAHHSSNNVKHRTSIPIHRRPSAVRADTETSAMDPSASEGSESDQSGNEAGRSGSVSQEQGGSKPNAPIQKRRRVTRACDECRRKKIKCDGRQPCTHCTVYSYECTYDQPSNRRRNPTPQYIEALERRLQRAEAVLTLVVPDLDLNNPELELYLQQGALPPSKPRIPHAATIADLKPKLPLEPAGAVSIPADDTREPSLESMVNATGSLDIDEEGNWDYHGHSSGLSFVRRIRQEFGDMMGPQGASAPFVKTHRPGIGIGMIDSPKSNQSSSPVDFLHLTDLPPKDVAIRLSGYALTDASALLKVVHTPTYYKLLNRVYDKSPDQHSNDESRFLPLLYAVLALGCLFTRDEDDNPLTKEGYESAIDQGTKYFKNARSLMDIGDCRDLWGVTALIFMILFLQSSAKLSTCYAYVGVALRSAMRMGLHRSFNNNFNPIEAEVRKRAFWCIRKMDIYVGALLGLPLTLSNDDIDQDFPSNVDDEFITDQGIEPMPAGSVTIMMAATEHVKLVLILSKIVKTIYPIKGFKNRNDGVHNTYSISYAKVRELEKDLQEWKENLPMGLRPGEGPPMIIRVQQLLRISYAHAQMMLYRPFLHYVGHAQKAHVLDQRAYACAMACVSVSRNIIHITGEMKKRELLSGAYWFNMYTTFFAIMSLVYFAVENPENPTSQAVLRDASEGRDTLAGLRKRSMAADRAVTTLGGLFDHLGERIKPNNKLSHHHTPSKKRSHATPAATAVQASSNPASHRASPAQTERNSRRAATYPRNAGEASKGPGVFPRALSISQTATPNESPYNGGSEDAESPTLSTEGNNGGFPPNAAQSAFTATGLHNPALADLSAMMFPSTDPFAYPNQAMTTFENTQYSSSQPYTQNNAHGRGSISNSAAAAAHILGTDKAYLSTGLDNDGLDVQLFGPLPPYMIQGEHPQLGLPPQDSRHHVAHQSSSSAAANNGLSYGAELSYNHAATQQQQHQHAQQQQQHAQQQQQQHLNGSNALLGADDWTVPQSMRTGGVPGMNLNDIFGGEDWGSGGVDHMFSQ